MKLKENPLVTDLIGCKTTKLDSRVIFFGTCDELSSHIMNIRCMISDSALKEELEVIVKTYIDIPDNYLDKPDILNSDTEKEYREELSCMLQNAAGDVIWEKPMSSISEDCQIISAKAYEEGIDDIEKMVNNWKTNYKNELNKFLNKHNLKF